MFLERYSESLLPLESHPGSIPQILSRFGKEYDREQATLNRSTLASVILQGIGEKFNLERPPSECPHYKYVLAESLLVGLGNPTDIERLNKILCGCTITHEDTISFMSGRRGNDYQPKSQCWRLSIELARLVKFMKQTEEDPPVTEAVNDEETLRKLLNDRKKIQDNNQARQMVFSTWKEVRPQIQSLFTGQDEQPRLPSPQITGSTETGLDNVKPNTSEIFSQLNIGGPEYQELIKWVEQTVLDPMLKLIGEKNTASYLKDKWYLFVEDTAQNCSNRPSGGFSGEIS